MYPKNAECFGLAIFRPIMEHANPIRHTKGSAHKKRQPVGENTKENSTPFIISTKLT